MALRRQGFPGENVRNGSVIVVKTHEFGPKTTDLFDKAILLIREPFSALQVEHCTYVHPTGLLSLQA